MSQPVMSFPISDLEKVRIVCGECGTAIEVKVENLPNIHELACPGCPPQKRNQIRASAKGADTFGDLAKVITALKQMKKIEVELVLPDELAAALQAKPS